MFNNAFQRYKPLFWQLDRRVRGEMEILQMLQILPDIIRQHSTRCFNKVYANTRMAFADIPVRFLQLIFIQIKQQAAVVVENRRCLCDLHRLIVKQKA